MLVKIFNAGRGNGKASVDYLFNEEKHEACKPVLMQGDPNLTKEIINSISRKERFTSGVISFRPEEKLTLSQQYSLMANFERTFSPFAEQGRVNFLWVKHEDKGRLELHFITPKSELRSNKAINISPPGKMNQLFFSNWTECKNHQFGFKQIDGSTLSNSTFKFKEKVYLDMSEKRAIYNIQRFDRNKKNPTMKNHDRAGINTATKSIKSISNKLREKTHGDYFTRPINTELVKPNFSFSTIRDKYDYSEYGRVEKIPSKPENFLFKTESDRGSDNGRKSKSSPISNTPTIGLSLEEEIRMLSIDLNSCDDSQVYGILTRINIAKGELDRIRPPSPRPKFG